MLLRQVLLRSHRRQRPRLRNGNPKYPPASRAPFGTSLDVEQDHGLERRHETIRTALHIVSHLDYNNQHDSGV